MITPWLPPLAIEYLDQIIRPNWNVFEWGSGTSTIYFVNKVGFVTSIEHDPVWYNALEKFVKNTLILCEPEEKKSEYTSQQYPGKCFEKYVRMYSDVIDYDLILIDGRCRAKCLEQIQDRVRKGAYVVLDNAERPQYQEAVSKIDWPSVTFQDKWKCIFWRKP